MLAAVSTVHHSIDLLTVLAIVLIIGGIVALVRGVVLLGAVAVVVGVILLLVYSNIFT